MLWVLGSWFDPKKLRVVTGVAQASGKEEEEEEAIAIYGAELGAGFREVVRTSR